MGSLPNKWDTLNASHGFHLYKIDYPTDYVDRCRKKEAYLQTYKSVIHLIPDETLWLEFENDQELLPEIRKMLGRQKMARRREPNEPSKQARTFILKILVITRVPIQSILPTKRNKGTNRYKFSLLFLHFTRYMKPITNGQWNSPCYDVSFCLFLKHRQGEAGPSTQ